MTMLRKLDIARSWALAREQFAALSAERDQQLHALAELRREVDELRAIVADVVTALRQKADADGRRTGPRRELERALLRLAPPDGKPLN